MIGFRNNVPCVENHVLAKLHKMEINGYENVMPVFSCAVSAYDIINDDEDEETFMDILMSGMSTCYMFGYSEEEFARIFCGLCDVSPEMFGIRS